MLDGVRPSAGRRSWWLREALAAEARSSPGLDATAPPLLGTTTADIVILGGGYTGLWTALGAAELAPGARIVLLEADICGGGPSGRNGGFVTGWWDDLPTLIERHGMDGALAAARAMDGAVDEIGRWCGEHGVDAWYTKAGSLSVSAAPAQDGRWLEATEACRAIGEGDRCCGAHRGRGSCAGRVAGAPGGGVHAGCRHGPARHPGPWPAPGGPRARDRDPRGHDGSSSSTASGPAGLGSRGVGSAGGGGSYRAPGPDPHEIGGGRRRGPGRAGGRGAQRVGRGVALLRSTAGDLVELHRPDRADPGPPRRARLDRRRGPCRRPVHAPLPAHDPRRADRDRWRWRPGRVRRSDRVGLHGRPRRGRAGGGRPAPALPVPARRPDRGRLGRPDRHLGRSPADVRERSGAPDPLRPRVTPATASGRPSSPVACWRGWRWPRIRRRRRPRRTTRWRPRC